ncbi:hypothetical protein GQ53DRAFT_759928 [Thozetella sp. PMI_491]|nr:hypothetical protein GQ53DRAFT_759928 [Thozetella sp. PMI_491]
MATLHMSRTGLSERGDRGLYDFLLEKDKLPLVRGAIYMIPRRKGQPREDLLVMCLRSAVKVIELYNSMLEARHITWTRGQFQVMFTAGRFAIVFDIVKDRFLRDSRDAVAGIHEPGAVHSDISLLLVADASEPTPRCAPARRLPDKRRLGQKWTSKARASSRRPINYPPSCRQPDQADVPAWPVSTNDTMEHLEARLGEFVWGPANPAENSGIIWTGVMNELAEG